MQGGVHGVFDEGPAVPYQRNPGHDCQERDPSMNYSALTDGRVNKVDVLI